MLARLLIFLGIAVVLFLPFNILTYRQLVRIHPRRRRLVIAGVIAGNLLWPFFFAARSFTPLGRAIRAILGPPWFGWTSFSILYSLFLFLLVIAWLLVGRRHAFAAFAHRPSKVFLWTLIIGFVIGYIQCIVPLRIEHVPVALENLPPQLDGKRIVVMGDLHVGLFTRPSRLTRFFEEATKAKPEFVVLAGDLVDDDPYFVPKLLAGTKALDPSIPLYAVLGNHEMYGDPFRVIASLKGSRIRLLVNEGVAYGPLWIAGISDYAARGLANEKPLVPDLARALRGMPSGAIPLAFAHQPKAFPDAQRLHVPLTVVAHTHGGQLGFRPLHWSLAGLFLPYHMGLYQRGAEQLYVNTGTGYWLFPFRLGMTPEITVIELRRRLAATPLRTSPRP